MTEMVSVNDPHVAALLRAVAPDEPLFLLRAADITAPAVVLNWAARRESLIQQSVKREADKALVVAARSLAAEMQAWYLRNRDNPAEIRAAFGPHVAGKVAERDVPA